MPSERYLSSVRRGRAATPTHLGPSILAGALVVVLGGLPDVALSVSSADPADGHVVYVTAPIDRSAVDRARSSAALRSQIRDAVGARLTGGAVAGGNEPVDLIVILVDAEGEPIFPDLEKARRAYERRAGRTSASTDMTFTFDSPDYPWDPGELSTLTTALADFYPTAKSIYGPPAFGITVNVRKDPTTTFAAYYNPSLNEMVLRTLDLGALAHEMIHAFRDDDLVGLASYEEGMTRAAEVEVFNQLPGYTHPFDEHHSDGYDVYYEGLNRPAVGPRFGNFFWSPALQLLRYQLGGYAWGKAFLENNSFFVDFNQQLYAQILSDDTARYTESKLLAIAVAVQATVEGQPFATWYDRQHVLNTASPEGYHLYQRINQFTFDDFYRDPSGSEIPQAGAAIDWEVTDYAGTLVDGGTGSTSPLGWVSVSPTLPPGYTGRIEVLARTATPEGVIADAVLRSAVTGSGVFGVVAGFDTGSVTVTPLDDPSPPETVAVVDGAFEAPSLETARGRFTAEFVGPASETIATQFTKDASRYFLALAVPECGNAVLDPGEQCEDGNALDGDGCDATCQFQPLPTPTPTPMATTTPLCPPLPVAGCRTPSVGRNAELHLRDTSPDTRDRLQWTWTKGAVTAKAEFGAPTSTTGYQLCVYDGGASLIVDAAIPAGGMCGTSHPRPCWVEKITGFNYRDTDLTPDGIEQLKLREGLVAGKARIELRGKGALLDDPTFPILQPVTVQLHSTAGICWGTVSSAPPIKNTAGPPGEFRDKSD